MVQAGDGFWISIIRVQVAQGAMLLCVIGSGGNG